MASSNCENCGFTGDRPGGGPCPRCGHAVAGFRVPPLPSPQGAVSTEVAPAGEAPPGGYLDLDLGDGGKPDPIPHATPAAGTPRHRPSHRSGPAFASVAPKEVPGSAKTILPIVMWVGAVSVALIILGIVLSQGDADAPDARGTLAPAPVAASPTPSAPEPAPAPSATPSGAVPAPAAVTPAAIARSEPAAPARRAEARSAERSRRERAPAPEPARPARREPAPAVAAQAAQTPAPTPAPSPPPAAVAPPTALVAPAAAPSPAVIEDAPRYATEGYRRPQMAEPQCVQRSIRAPRDLADRVDGPVSIRFAVGPDGDISLFQIMGDVPDQRLPAMLESAVRACRFTPGADAQGNAVRMWVTMPIRFAR